MRCLFLAAIGIFPATLALSEPTPLSSEAIKQVVSGSTVRIDTPLGAALPVSYSEDGMLSGEAGYLAFYLGSRSDRGRWWVVGDKLCHKWNSWFDAEINCLRLRQDGDKFFWRRDDGMTGTATIVAKPAPVSVAIAAPVTAATPSPYGLGGPQPGTAKGEAVAQPIEPRHDPVAPPPGLSSPSPVSREAAAPPPPSPPPIAVKPVEALQTFAVTGVPQFDVLNVRNGPSADHAIIGRLAPDSRGIRIDGPCVDGWCQIRFRAVAGWVNRSWLISDLAVGNASQQAGRSLRLAPRRAERQRFAWPDAVN